MLVSINRVRRLSMARKSQRRQRLLPGTRPERSFGDGRPGPERGALSWPCHLGSSVGPCGSALRGQPPVPASGLVGGRDLTRSPQGPPGDPRPPQSGSHRVDGEVGGAGLLPRCRLHSDPPRAPALVHPTTPSMPSWAGSQSALRAPSSTRDLASSSSGPGSAWGNHPPASQPARRTAAGVSAPNQIGASRC